MKTPKQKLRRYWSQYLQEQDKYLDFKDWLENTDIHNYVKLTLECGFSTTPECRKAINELESTTVTLPVTQEKRVYDILSDSKTEPSEEEIDKAWNDVATQIGGYKEETWQDILDEFSKFGKGKLGDWLIKNFKTPERL